MESQENEEQKVLQMNELFDELLDDAYDFSKDITMSIRMMPFASYFILITAIAYSWFSFVWLKESHILWKIPEGILVLILLYLSGKIFFKSREFKKKYSTLFNLKEELDAMKE